LETTATSGAKTTVNNASRSNGEAATSRIGFRGTEDLGGGMKANFVLESGIAADTALTFGGRAFWAGLEDSKMGQIRVGRQDAFTRTLWLGADQLAAANVVGNVAYDNGTAMADSETTSHTTRHNGVNYISPRMGGVQLSLGVMQAETETTTRAKTGSGSQVGLSYVAGKFTAGAAYAVATTSTNAVAGVAGNCILNTGGTTLSAVTATETCGSTKTRLTGKDAAAATDVKTKDTAAAATYDLGFAKVAYIYNKREAVNSVDLATASNTDRTSHAFSASVPLSAKLTGRVGYGYGEYSSGASSAYNGDFKGMQAALNYDLSKRTMLYGIYGESQRDMSATTEVKAKEYSVGVRHSF
jgi:predicted porin